ncbi:hypothetical protein MBOE_15730 [Mycolicibacterium boenickei]|uniref:Uncharacterized protein n=1 Tax=Mycolicibacterium boenickei TaxID=146017 RepID=A0ABN5ZAJ1_9MYCO|nr:hypothetical protein MBOE_15730 [Mycolicibacterium boenickei]
MRNGSRLTAAAITRSGIHMMGPTYRPSPGLGSPRSPPWLMPLVETMMERGAATRESCVKMEVL